MAQVKGTLWFGTDITDDALRKAQQLRRQIEQQFTSPINVKINVQDIDQQQSRRVQDQLQNLASAINAQNVNLSWMTTMKTELGNIETALAGVTAGYEKLLKQMLLVQQAQGGTTGATNNSILGQRTINEELRKRNEAQVKLNSNMNATLSITGRLTDSMVALFSVAKARDFLEQVIKIGGQLEQQRVSIGAILHNTAHADDLFNRIKGLALQSPFGVLDLDKYTKQLSAYGFQYNELYDMTKRLADISAGAGTDISRLALALGHVKSATYLTGITLRQFSMNNIPMLKMLSDYYSELEKRIVTTAEVQKRISQRDVGYEDVIEVIKRMTDEGGQFYNMQAVMADTLAGKWKNLKDAVELMYGSIGESFVGDALKDLAGVLTSLTKKWQYVAAVIASVATTHAALRVGTMMLNRAVGTESAIVARNEIAWKKAQAVKLSAAAKYRILTAEEEELIATRNRLTVTDITRLMVEKKLDKEYVLRSIVLRKLSKEEAQEFVVRKLLTQAEVDGAIAMSKHNRLINVLKLNIAGLGRALKSLWASALPGLAIFAAISAVLEGVASHQQRAAESADNIKHALDTATEGYKNLSEVVNQYEVGNSKGMSNDALQQAVNSMINTLKDYSSQAQNIIRNALYVNPNETDAEKMHMRSLAEQYEILAKSISDVKDAYALMEKASDVFENANAETGGTWFGNDSFRKNVKDWLGELKNVRKAETEFLRDRVSLNKALEETGLFPNASSASLEDVKKYVQGLELVSDEWKRLQDYAENFEGGLSFQGGFNALRNAKEDLDSARAIMDRDLERFADKALADLQTKFGKATKDWGVQERLAAQQLLVIHLNSIEGMTDETLKDVEQKVYDRWGKMDDYLKRNPLKVDADIDRAMKQLSEFQRYLEELIGHDWVVTLQLQKVGSFEELYDELNKAVKDFKDFDKKELGLSREQKDRAKAVAKQIANANNPSNFANKKDQEKAQKDAKKAMDSLDKKTREYAENYIRYEEAKSTAKKENMKLDALVEKQTNRSGGKKTDELARQMSERVQLLRKAQQEYKKWLNLESEAEAFNRVKNSGIFKPLFGDNKINSLNDISDVLKEYRSKLNPGKEEQRKVIATIDELLLGMPYDKAKDKADMAAELIKSTIDKIAKQWDTYQSLYQKTGDKMFSQLAFSNGILWDDKTRAMADTLDNESGYGVISYDMSEDEAKEFFKYNTVEGKALYEQWKQIVDLIHDNYSNSLIEIANAREKQMTNAEKIKKIETDIANLKKKEKGVGEGDPRIKEMREEINRLKGELFEMMPIYDEIFGDRKFKSYDELKKVEEVVKDLIKNAKAGAMKNGKASFYSSFFLDDEGKHDVTMTREQLERLKKIIDDYFNDKKKVNPFRLLIDKIKEMRKAMTDGDKETKVTQESWKQLAATISDVTKIISSLTGELSAMFDALGNENLADAMSDVQAGMDSLSNIANGFAQGGPIGGIVATTGEAIKWVTRLANRHDKKLNKSIEKSARKVKELQNAYKNLESEISRALGGIYTAGGYDEMFENYKSQLTELEKQRKAENDKKKKDQDKILDYDQQIEEMKDTIEYFAQDMAKNLYDIDIKSWAQELTDAVVEAWVKGEDAAQAWHDKVSDLVKDITKNVLAQKVVENALNPVLDYITKQMTEKNGKLDEASITGIARMLETAGESSVNTITSLLDAMKKAGYDLTDAESAKSGNLSSSISSITEEAGDLLLSHVNAIRADVSMTRFNMDRVVTQIEMELPIFGQSLAEQTVVLRSIESNTGRNADSAEMIESFCRGLRDGTYSIKVK